ncbi:hypothetical protein [Burkholderia anthina]|uniref:hypothetical protein n=1 Tax=Burkholderia anthina TaxID=179879 RepID=UPI0015887194|nr:hypothetical protein [Burkholderia anthina]
MNFLLQSFFNFRKSIENQILFRIGVEHHPPSLASTDLREHMQPNDKTLSDIATVADSQRKIPEIPK